MPGGNYLASGIEHNEHGAPTASGAVHGRMNAKRIDKLRPLKYRRDLYLIEGDPDAPIALVSWGSVAGVAREAVERAQVERLRVKLLVPKLLYPVSEEIYRDFFASVEAGLVVEQSHQGQLFRVLRMFVDLPDGVRSLAKSGSNPITATEIVERLRALVLDIQRRRAPELRPTE
jgi:2-oxoglutarate ferredoxin oxidoreductase subunit alpha